jgi:hypothetical protein
MTASVGGRSYCKCPSIQKGEAGGVPCLSFKVLKWYAQSEALTQPNMLGIQDERRKLGRQAQWPFPKKLKQEEGNKEAEAKDHQKFTSVDWSKYSKKRKWCTCLVEMESVVQPALATYPACPGKSPVHKSSPVMFQPSILCLPHIWSLNSRLSPRWQVGHLFCLVRPATFRRPGTGVTVFSSRSASVSQDQVTQPEYACLRWIYLPCKDSTMLFLKKFFFHFIFDWLIKISHI